MVHGRSLAQSGLTIFTAQDLEGRKKKYSSTTPNTTIAAHLPESQSF